MKNRNPVMSPVMSPIMNSSGSCVGFKRATYADVEQISTWYQSDREDTRTCTECGQVGGGKIIRDADQDDFIVHEACDPEIE